MKTTTNSFAPAAVLMMIAGFAPLAAAQYAGPAFTPKGALMGLPWKTGLSTHSGAPIWDHDLAGFATPAAQNGSPMTFAMGQCYAGGMVQDLGAITPRAGGPAVVLSATSASKWNQPAWYPEGNANNRAVPMLNGAATPNDHYFDWVDSYHIAMGGATAINAANNAWRRDPFGTNTGGAAGNVDQGPGEAGRPREHGQYRETNAAARNQNHLGAANTKYAVLYSGQPKDVDAEQMGRVWAQLLGDGYAMANIHVVFGAGWDPMNPDPIVGMLPVQARNQAVEATVANLISVFAGFNNFDETKKVFFLSNDHGTAWNANMPIDKWVEMPKLPVYPSGSGGSQSQGTLPYDLEMMPQTLDFEGYFGQYYVPTPGSLALLGLGGLLVTWRRR